MAGICASKNIMSEPLLISRLSDLGFGLFSRKETGLFFQSTSKDTCIIIDQNICSMKNYPYVDYTQTQNRMAQQYDRVFRFLHEDDNNVDSLLTEINCFLNEESDPEKIRRIGRNRHEQDIDPTLPESQFEDCFLEAFGEAAGNCLHREFPYADFEGKTRFLDYALFTGKQKFAIELNGESFHHPCIIGQQKYRSQLFKQNSLSADGFKVFRWSMRGMQDREKFISEIQMLFGGYGSFIPKAAFKLSRQLTSKDLYEHQTDTLDYLACERKNGRRAFLIFLPTGTGKTEIFITDICRLQGHPPDLKALVVVPTRKLRDQTLARFKERAPGLQCSQDIFCAPGQTRVWVQTTAFLQRHYYKIPPEQFDYLVVDEAHHAVAPGMRKVLEHFNPEHLLGLTATPCRLDRQRLEEIFGDYEARLTLEEAVQKGLIPPIRCYRVESNIDLSEVRFNGRDYVKGDLQRTVVVPSRDQLIGDVLCKYFSGPFSEKQGVVFCVDIRHACRMATLLKQHGIDAMAVSGKDQKGSDTAVAAYNEGRIRFLCACDILTEGWDSPRTSILVMARPTFSRVLYTQQLGRGTRHFEGKEALYVIDVVDNYGASKLQPLSLHALFGIPEYRPFDNVIKPLAPSMEDEILVLDGLFEQGRRIQPVNIFNFEKLYGDYVNEEQLARELFVSTGTVKSWLKKGTVKSDVQYPFGRSLLHFFHPDQIDQIRKALALKDHTEETRKADFMEFLEARDYTFSYKIIFLLSLLKVMNKRGEAVLPDLIKNYQKFYRQLYDKHGRDEKEGNPYNQPEFLADEKQLQHNMLQNPFEKFERKRFIYHCKDLNYIAFDPKLWEMLKNEDFSRFANQMREDLKAYYQKLNIIMDVEDYGFLTADEQAVEKKSRIVRVDFPSPADQYNKVLPLYPLSIAAGTFLDSQTPIEPETWIVMTGLTPRTRFDKSMFISQIQGKSMEPLIPDGSYCLFTFETAGSRNGKIVLAQKIGLHDIDTGAQYTLKRYQSTKKGDPDTEWTHEKIMLKAINPDYEDIEILSKEADDLSIVAFWVETFDL
jgi:superfamily II DNA or RNA helicase